MSSHKTENYELHVWEPGDDFLRSEFNTNFAALDGLLVTGSYTGDKAPGRIIQLGFTPRAVLVMMKGYQSSTGSDRSGGLFLKDVPLMDLTRPLAEVVEGGFQLHSELPSSSSYNNYINHTGYYYTYLALK